jgi:hypothetical protein
MPSSSVSQKAIIREMDVVELEEYIVTLSKKTALPSGIPAEDKILLEIAQHQLGSLVGKSKKTDHR